MKRFLISLVIFLLIAAAIGYLLYPTLSDQLSQSADAEVMKNYRAKTAAKHSASAICRNVFISGERRRIRFRRSTGPSS